MQPHHLPFLQKTFNLNFYELHLCCSWKCCCGHFTGWETTDTAQPVCGTAQRFQRAETCTHMKFSLCTDTASSQPLPELSVPNRVERSLQPHHREPVQALSCHLKRDLTAQITHMHSRQERKTGRAYICYQDVSVRLRPEAR